VDFSFTPEQEELRAQARAFLATHPEPSWQELAELGWTGVSVGEADFIKPALAELGSTEFWKIAIKPGRPLTFGEIDNSVFMGLPGNPVAVMVTFSQFVAPAIEVLSGAHMRPPLLVPARALERIRKKPGRTEFQRGILARDDQGQWNACPTGAQGSGVLRSMSEANCFIVLEETRGNVEAGARVSVQMFEGLF